MYICIHSRAFFRPLNTIPYAILDTNPGLHSVYLVDILLFCFTFYILPTIHYLRIIYIRNTGVLTYKLEVLKPAGVSIKKSREFVSEYLPSVS